MAKKLQNLPNGPASSEQIVEIERQLKRLGKLYNRYFTGNLKRPPEQQRMQLERKMRDLSKDRIRNAALRYRYQNLVATYASMQALWNRKLREKETGVRVGAPMRTVDRFAERRVRTFLCSSNSPDGPRKEKASPRNPRAEDSSDSNVPKVVDRLYRQIVEHQKAAGRDPSFQSAGQLARFLAVQKARIAQKTGTDEFQLKVVLQEGQLKLRVEVPRGDS